MNVYIGVPGSRLAGVRGRAPYYQLDIFRKNQAIMFSTAKIICIMKRELDTYFKSPVAYTCCALFLSICGFLFYNIIKYSSIQSMKLVMMQREAPMVILHDVIFRPTFHNIAVILLLITPILTMKLLAGEKRDGTMELLLTSPITVTDIIMGKFLGAFALLAILLLLTVLFPFILGFYRVIDWSAQLSGYLGIILTGGTFAAIGIFGSSLTKNQIIAALYSTGMIMLFWMIGFLESSVDNQTAAEIFYYLSIFNHLDDFQKGFVHSSDIIYFISMISLFLFFSHRAIDSHRWK